MDCVLNILSLRLGDTGSYLNVMGEYSHFCFKRQSTLWGQGANSPQPFVGCGFNFSPIFKALQVSVDFSNMGPTCRLSGTQVVVC